MSICEVIEMQKAALEKLDSIAKSIEELQKKLRAREAERLGVVELRPYHYVFYIDTLFRWLEHVGVIVPTIVEAPITLGAGAKGYADLWLPGGIACVERTFELFFPTSRGLKYGWMVDSTTEFTVPMHHFIPNKGYVEESVFGKYWIKWYFLRFHFEAIEPGQIVIRAWARLIKHRDLEKLLELASPLAEMFEVSYPPPRVTPLVTGSETIKECKICGAKLLKVDDKTVRVGTWGRNYTDHECEVFY